MKCEINSHKVKNGKILRKNQHLLCAIEFFIIHLRVFLRKNLIVKVATCDFSSEHGVGQYDRRQSK
jgi:hypothetical protein